MRTVGPLPLQASQLLLTASLREDERVTVS
jgi:hypothetical protein